MASTLSNIIDAIKSLMEGSSGERTISSGTFKYHKTAESFFAAKANRNPRPFVIEVTEDLEPEGFNSDLSGNYIYQGKRVTVIVSYADMPHDPLTLEKTISDDRLTILKTLSYPLNWSTVSDWVDTKITTNREAHMDDQGNIDLQYLIVELSLTFRETYI